MDRFATRRIFSLPTSCYLLCCGFMLLTFSLNAQVLRGVIHDGLDESRGLQNIRVEVTGFSTERTDELGRFSLSLPGKQRGAMLKLYVSKPGYAVINRENLRPRIPAEDTEEIVLFMCAAGQRDSLAQIYYKIQVERTISFNYSKAAKILADSMNFEKIADLTQKKNQAENMADSLAARLARFDPNQASSELAQAMQLYQAGHIDQAFEVLNIDKILARIQARNQAIKELKAATTQDIEALMKAADMSLSELQFEQAQEYLEAAVQADSGNYERLRILCAFLLTQDQGQALAVYAQQLVKLARNEMEEGGAWTYVGIAAQQQDAYPEALKAFQEAAKRYEALEKTSPTTYKHPLAGIFNNLGLAYADVEAYEKAVDAYQESLTLYNELSQAFPKRFDAEIASTLHNLGSMLQSLNRFEEALTVIQRAIELRQALVASDSSRYQEGLAITLQNLGSLYLQLKQYEFAKSAYGQSLKIHLGLSAQNTQAYAMGLGDAYYGLGSVFIAQLELPMARWLYQQADSAYGLNQGSKRAQTRQQKAKQQVAVLSAPGAQEYAYSRKGYAFFEQQQRDSAVYYWQKAVVGYEQLPLESLSLSDRYNATFAYEYLNYFSDDPSKRYAVQQKVVAIREKALEASPEDRAIKRALISAYNNLASASLFVEAYVEAEAVALRSLALEPTATGVVSTWVSSLVFQGELADAEEKVRAWKDKPWGDERYQTVGEALLAQWSALEAAGITHRGLKKLRKLLKSKER